MPITARRLQDKNQTAREMYRIIRSYSSDLDNIKVWRGGKLVPISMLPLIDVYEMVRRIPYRQDTKPIEVVARPGKIIRSRLMGMDCKKKAVLLSAYLNQRGLPWRLMSSSRLRNRRIHHVFPQIKFLGNWLNFDATYPHYRPFEQKMVTKTEVL